DVARELIEQDHQRERAAGRCCPLRVCPVDRRIDVGAETRADRRVERRVLAKPLGALGFAVAEPELQYFLRECVHRVRYSSNREKAMQKTSHRDIFLLACCQALLLINNAGLISMSAVIGYSLVENKTYASLGATTYVLGSALSTMPASLWMGRVGRRRG